MASGQAGGASAVGRASSSMSRAMVELPIGARRIPLKPETDQYVVGIGVKISQDIVSQLHWTWQGPSPYGPPPTQTGVWKGPNTQCSSGFSHGGMGRLWALCSISAGVERLLAPTSRAIAITKSGNRALRAASVGMLSIAVW